MRSLDEMLASSLWTRELSPEQLQRVRAAVIVREFAAGGTVCHKGEPANLWIGVIDGNTTGCWISRRGSRRRLPRCFIPGARAARGARRS